MRLRIKKIVVTNFLSKYFVSELIYIFNIFNMDNEKRF